jgi:hypothetical protein
MPWRSFGVVFVVVMLAACGGEPLQPPNDAGGDAPSADAARDVAAADRPAEPTPAEWAACPDNIMDLAYAVTSCSYVSGGFGVSHPARMRSVEPTWIVDGTVGNRAMTLEEGVDPAAHRGSTSFAALARCDLRQLPPACRCTTCAGQLFDVRTCSGFETGRMYLQLQLLRIGQMVERTGYCPRL